MNTMVADNQLDAELNNRCTAIMQRSATARISSNLDSEQIRKISSTGMRVLNSDYDTDKSKEGVRASREKRTLNLREPAK